MLEATADGGAWDDGKKEDGRPSTQQQPEKTLAPTVIINILLTLKRI